MFVELFSIHMLDGGKVALTYVESLTLYMVLKASALC